MTSRAVQLLCSLDMYGSRRCGTYKSDWLSVIGRRTGGLASAEDSEALNPGSLSPL